MSDQLNNLLQTSVYMLPWATFLIGLLGSVHCVGMCGGLVVTCTPSRKNNVFYQIGRLTSYLILAIVSASLGHLLNLNNSASKVSLFFGIVIGLTFIWIGVSNYTHTIKAPKWFSKIIYSKWAKVLPKNPAKVSLRSSFSVGAFSIFLPCGFLYGVLLTLASFQSPLISMISIFTFWLGTLPVMGFASNIISKIIKPLLQKMPLVTSSVLVIIGIITIYNRLEFLFVSAPSCH